MTADATVIHDLLSRDGRRAAVEVWHRFPAYTPVGYGSFLTRDSGRAPVFATNPGRFPQRRHVPPAKRFAPKLELRADARRHFLRTGGHAGDAHDPLLAFRHRYFRETYAYGRSVFVANLEPILHHPQLVDAARARTDRVEIAPAIVYANLLLPGQELGLHYDVPEFRGADVGQLPGWLLVAMHHSGLFARWRLPLATAVVYVGECDGGDFIYYPDGERGAPTRYVAQDNSAIMLDADAVLHGVDRVHGDDSPLAGIGKDTILVHIGGGRWQLRGATSAPTEEAASYTSGDIRFSISWKAYCFADRAERARWASREDDLTIDTIVDVLVRELCARGRLETPEHGLSQEHLGLLIIDEFVPFPDEHAVAAETPPGVGSRDVTPRTDSPRPHPTGPRHLHTSGVAT